MEQLAKLDPSRMTHDEKLAFWINLYNALIMHVNISIFWPVVFGSGFSPPCMWSSVQNPLKNLLIHTCTEYYPPIYPGLICYMIGILFTSFCIFSSSGLHSLDALISLLILSTLCQAYLAYGIPKSDVKFFSLMQKVSILSFRTFYVYFFSFWVFTRWGRHQC